LGLYAEKVDFGLSFWKKFERLQMLRKTVGILEVFANR